MATTIVLKHPSGSGGMERIISEGVAEVVEDLNASADRLWTWFTLAENGKPFGVKPADVLAIRDAEFSEPAK